MYDLPRGVHGDVDPAAFEQADVRAMQVAGFGEAHRLSGRIVFLKSNSSRTGNRSFPAIRSSTANEGALTPRSIRLRKSTLIPTSSKLFLGQLAFQADCLQPDSELLPERLRHLGG